MDLSIAEKHVVTKAPHLAISGRRPWKSYFWQNNFFRGSLFRWQLHKEVNPDRRNVPLRKFYYSSTLRRSRGIPYIVLFRGHRGRAQRIFMTCRVHIWWRPVQFYDKNDDRFHEAAEWNENVHFVKSYVVFRQVKNLFSSLRYSTRWTTHCSAFGYALGSDLDFGVRFRLELKTKKCQRIRTYLNIIYRLYRFRLFLFFKKRLEVATSSCARGEPQKHQIKYI